jgi:transcriptional regulator with XRE-family HTH domain
MASRERAGQRADRFADRGLHLVGDEIRRSRGSSGLSLRALAAATGISHAEIGRIERGRSPNVPYRRLVRLCDAVGLELSIKAYPGGDPIRDAGHSRLLGRFRARLHADLRLRLEVPLPIEGDRRAWDAMIEGRGWRRPVEAETVVDDIQALERRMALKRRDGGFDHIVLLVADTKGNRAALAGAPMAFGDYPLGSRQVLDALAAGRDPAAGGIVVL